MPVSYPTSIRKRTILKLVNTLICNTKGEGEKRAEEFLDQIGTPAVFGPHWLYLVRSAGR